MKRYRYPGFTPFSENDQNIYWGRKDDIQKVFNSITLNQSTVLVGRSGIGKTSLIYAEYCQ
jgi:putative ribosome biogenesis GTPase RsgA